MGASPRLTLGCVDQDGDSVDRRNDDDEGDDAPVGDVLPAGVLYSPIKGRSLSKRMRKVRAAGSRVTATTWTKIVIAFWTAFEHSSGATPAERSMSKYAA